MELRSTTELNLTSSIAPEVQNEIYDNAREMEPFISIDSTGAIILTVVLYVLYFLGLFGNGKVIWILGFHMKRNCFSIYLLNLAVADIGVIIIEALVLIALIFEPKILTIYYIFFLCFALYYTSQLLLISISVDRCVSVLFPIWQQCHRPPKLTLVVCAVAWILSSVLITLQLFFSDAFLVIPLIFSLIFYPAMVTSTLILLVKMKQLQLKRKKTLWLPLLAVMCFIAFHLPLFVLSIFNFKGAAEPSKEIRLLVLLSNICMAVNSSINPILYFLAGRNKGEGFRVSMKGALQRIFKNEDTNEDEMQPDEI